MKKPRITNLLIAGIPLLLIVVFIILVSPSAQNQESGDPRPSTFSTDAAGAKAVFLVMKEFLPSVERWMKPLSFIPLPEGDEAQSLLVLGPSVPLTSSEADALDEWVEEGGQLILAAREPWLIQDTEESSWWQSAEEAQDTKAEDYLARHGFVFASHTKARARTAEYSGRAGSLTMAGRPLSLDGVTPLLSSDSRVVGAEKAVGKGTIVFVSDPLAWSNARLLTAGDNSPWLVLLAGRWGNGRLLVDEYHLGFQEGRQAVLPLLVSFLGTPWGAAFIQLFAAGVLFLISRMRRFGPVLPLPPERARTPMERAAGIGAFLEAARARGFAARTMGQLLTRRLSRDRAASRPLPPVIAELLQKSSLTDGELVSLARRAGQIMEEQSHAQRGHR